MIQCSSLTLPLIAGLRCVSALSQASSACLVMFVWQQKKLQCIILLPALILQNSFADLCKWDI